MKKTSYLQTLYLQKPWLLIILIAIIATLPWIGLGDFYTKGEPREATLALSMLNDGHWIVPYGYADEFAYKPPFNHWLIAGFSYLFNGGEVTPFTTRLPSVIGFIGLIGICFMFFARRRTPLESFVTCLILITCFEIHRAAVTTRLDMLLAFFIVTGIIQLYVWWESGKKRYIFSSILFLSLATLVKGPVGAVIPCLVFGVFLLIRKENFFKVIGKCILIGLPALIPLILWYISAYQIKGDEFYNLVFAENVGRFLRIEDADLGIKYKLGVENPWWFYFVSLLAGFVPHTLLMLISLFFLKYTRSAQPVKQSLINWWNKFSVDKVSVYSLVAIIMILAFFLVPASKRSTYILPVYPFVAFFMARFMVYLAQNKPKSVRIYSFVLLSITGIILLICTLAVLRIIDLESLSHLISKRERTLHDIKLVSDGLRYPTLIGGTAILLLLITFIQSIRILKRHSNIKVLMATFALVIALNILLDGCILPQIKNGYSSRPFAEQISKKYDLKDKTYVMNDLLKYANMYGLNFYLGNKFRNFEKELPDDGYLLIGNVYRDDIMKQYNQYQYTALDSCDRNTDYKMPVILYKIEKLKNY